MIKKLVFLCSFSFLLMACTENGFLFKSKGEDYNKESLGVYKIGAPYQVNGIWYRPEENYKYKEVGIASWYGPDFHNGITANGERYDMHALTAAHRTLPLPSIAKVTNLENGRSVFVRVNDRGPFVNNRIIDVSKKAAEMLGFEDQGTAKVRIEIMEDESKALKKEILDHGGKFVDGGAPMEEIVPQNAVIAIPVANPIEENPISLSKTQWDDDPETAKSLEKEEVLFAPKKDVTAPKKEVSKETVQAPASQPGYYVQAGAFSKIENANALKSRLSTFGNVSITEKQAGSGTIYRVRIGPFKSGEEGVALMDRMKESGYSDIRLVEELAKGGR